MWVRIFSIVLEKELKVLDLMTELLLFNLFPLFLHFLASLIKLILWLKLFHRQKVG